MPKPVLILYSAESCSACKNFLDKNWDNVKKETLSHVKESRHLSQKSMSMADWNPEMPNVKSMVSFFPTIFLVRASDLAAWDRDKTALVTAVPFPAKERSDIIEWIKETSLQPNLTSTALTGQPQARSQPAPAPAVRSPPSIAGAYNGSVCSAAYSVRGRK